MVSRTVTIDATAQHEKSPDLATVTALAIGGAGTPSDARAIATDRAARLRESITDVSADRIRTVEIQVQDTDEMFESDTETAFQGTVRLQVDCVPENAKSVVVAVTNAGGTVQGVQFQLHESERRGLQNRSITSAMERAREKAEQIAAAEDLDVAGVREVSTNERTTGMESIVDEALASSSDIGLHPTPITVSEGVEVVYELIEK